jgi:hypothetical protein
MTEYYSLDSDPDFSNHNNGDKNVATNIVSLLWCATITKLAFPKDLRSVSQNEFDELHVRQNIRIPRKFQYKKSFLRFELHDNDPTFVYNAIKEISKITLSFVKTPIQYDDDWPNTPLVNEPQKYQISLLLNLLLLEENGEKIDLIDVEQIIKQYSVDELIKLNIRKNNKEWIVNTKYMFKNKKAFYLDIPLLDEFYNTGSTLNNIEHYHDKNYKLNCDDIYFQHFDNITIGFESATLMTKKADEYLPHLLGNNGDRLSSRQYQMYIINNRVEIFSWLDEWKSMYVVVTKDIITPILVKPYTTIMYDIYDYFVYKVDVYDGHIAFLEFDNCEDLTTVTIIKTEILS